MIKFVIEKRSDSRFSIRSMGLNAVDHAEICAEVFDSDLIGEAEQFLNYVADYLVNAGKHIKPGETMAYGYWLVKFERAEQDTLEAWEYAATASDFVEGINLTLRYWRDQHAICNQHDALFKPPRPDKLTVISDGVLEGLPVQGVRYPSPDHMSGWWITTDLYNGNIQTLRNEHTYHITAARPDLAKYLALPDGFRFDLSTTEDVWLDEKTLNSAG